jgi:opacity protein-like surface antigen
MAAAPVHTDKGDKAMVFQFSGLSELGLSGPGDSWGVGMRYYISDMNAIRGGLIFGNDRWTEKAQEEGQDDLDHKESEYGFEVGYERHLEAPCASVSPYIGAGAAYYTWKSECPAGEGREYAKDKESESGFNVHAMAGFEWGFTECMTLGGEYQLGMFSGSYKEEIDSGGQTYTIDEEEYSWMGFSTASVFLSVYW